ncbi:MAG TPA: CorA family divalent cation transporter [Lysobacter sp.]
MSDHNESPPASARDGSTRVRALLFEHERPSREIDPASIAASCPVPDHRLLWVDIVASDATAALAGLGADPRRLDPAGGTPLGIAFSQGWKYLHVHALNWHDGRTAADEPVAVGVGPNIVVTVHRAPVDFIDDVLENEADHLRIGRLEAISFATGLLDRMLTDYLDARDAFETAVDRLEIFILRRPRPGHLSELQGLRHLASKLRRRLAAQRNATCSTRSAGPISIPASRRRRRATAVRSARGTRR